MILAWLNKWDAASLVVGSEIATLPGTNVQRPHLSRRWHTNAVNSSHQVGDMGAATLCSILGVFGSNLTAAATYRVRASNVDPAAVASLLLDTGTLAAGVKTGYGAIYKTFTPTTARYWRVDVTDASLVNLQVGRIFVGPHWSHAQTLLYGWGVTPSDPSSVRKSRGGQSYPDPLPKFRALEFALDFLTESEAFTNPFAMARDNGVVRDILAIPYEGSSFLSEQAVWGLAQVHEPVQQRYSQIWRTKIRVEERL